MSVSLCLCVSVSLSLSVCLSVCLSLSVSVSVSVCVRVCVSVCVSARCSIPQHHFQMPNSGKSNILPAFCQGSKIVTRFQEPLLFFFGFFSFSSPSVASPLGSATSCGGACDTWTLELCGKLTVPWGRNSASVRRPRQIQAMVTWIFSPGRLYDTTLVTPTFNSLGFMNPGLTFRIMIIK